LLNVVLKTTAINSLLVRAAPLTVEPATLPLAAAMPQLPRRLQAETLLQVVVTVPVVREILPPAMVMLQLEVVTRQLPRRLQAEILPQVVVREMLQLAVEMPPPAPKPQRLAMARVTAAVVVAL
jgi:hypothetical protein